MKKIILLLTFELICLPHANVFSEEKFGYGSLGSIGGYPTVGGGYRMQHGFHGLDFSGKFMPWLPFPPAAEIRGMYLLYPRQKGFYLGSGLGYVWMKENLRYGAISFDVALGYQWETARGRKLFVQAEGIVPLKKTSAAPIWPALTFGIGF